MIHTPTRRQFVTNAGSLAAAAVLAPRSFAASAPAGMRFGYTAMTWGKDERQAVDDIAALGFAGIQFRIDAVTDFKPAELRDLLARRKLTFVALSSGEVSLDNPGASEIAKHVANARFLQQAGGLYLQVLDQLKPYPRTASPEDCKRLGMLLTSIGKQTAELGIQLGYHNHMNTIGEHPDNLARILDAADPKYVMLELDTAHSVAGGGDPAKIIEQYHDRLLFVHLKDVVDQPMASVGSKYPFQWVELGKGRVDLPAVFAALRKVRFAGWAVVELDRSPDKSRTAKECAAISRDYLEHTLGVHLS
jgi:inosose dehydratase